VGRRPSRTTSETKVSTSACVGVGRPRKDWWPTSSRSARDRAAGPGRKVGAAGAGIGDLGNEGAVRVRGADAETVEREALLSDRVPHPELAEDAQGVALEGDAGAKGADIGLDVDEVDRDALLGEEDRRRSAGGTGSDDEDRTDGRHERGSFAHV